MSETPWSLRGRTAFITGGSRGLGEAMAHAFLAAGANVALCARSAGELKKASKRLSREFPEKRVLAVPLDVTSLSAVQESVAGILNTFGVSIS